MTTETGGPAFPLGNTPEEWMNGLTLRDYFAAKAMQAMNANPYWDDTSFYDVAQAAYQMADEMITARTK